MDKELNPNTPAVSDKNDQTFSIEINEPNDLTQIRKNHLIKIATSIIYNNYEAFNKSLQHLLNDSVPSALDTVKNPEDFEKKKSLGINVTFFITGAPEPKHEYTIRNNENNLNYIQGSFPSIELDDLCFLYVTELKYWALLHVINKKYKYNIAYNYMTEVGKNELGCIQERFNTETSQSQKFKEYLKKICDKNGCPVCNNQSKQSPENKRFYTDPLKNNINSVYKTGKKNQTTVRKRQEEREEAIEKVRERREKKRKEEEKKAIEKARKKEEETNAKIKRYIDYVTVTNGTIDNNIDNNIKTKFDNYKSRYINARNKKIKDDVINELKQYIYQLLQKNRLYHREVHLYF